MGARIGEIVGFLWSTDGTVSRRQWWAGHFAAIGLTVAGMLGLGLTLASLASALDVDPTGPVMRVIVLGAAVGCALAFVLASNALCRKRLRDKGQSMALVNAAIALAVVELAAKGLAASGVALPELPLAIVSQFSFVALSVLILECGVFERFSLLHLVQRGQASKPAAQESVVRR